MSKNIKKKKTKQPAKECAERALTYLKENQVDNQTFREILEANGVLSETSHGLRKAGGRAFKNKAHEYITENGRTPKYSNILNNE